MRLPRISAVNKDEKITIESFINQNVARYIFQLIKYNNITKFLVLFIEYYKENRITFRTFSGWYDSAVIMGFNAVMLSPVELRLHWYIIEFYPKDCYTIRSFIIKKSCLRYGILI